MNLECTFSRGYATPPKPRGQHKRRVTVAIGVVDEGDFPFRNAAGYPVLDENTAAANSYVSPEAFYNPGGCEK